MAVGGEHTAPLFRILDTRAFLDGVAQVSLRSSTALSSAFCSRAAFSSSVSGGRRRRPPILKATSSTAPRASMTNWSGSSADERIPFSLSWDAAWPGQLGQAARRPRRRRSRCTSAPRACGPCTRPGGELALLGGEEEQQILQKLLVGAVVAHHAHLDLVPKASRRSRTSPGHPSGGGAARP